MVEIPVKDQYGNLLTKDSAIKTRWLDHFETVLNRPVPPAEDVPAAERGLDMESGESTIGEVKKAIQQLKNHKAQGEDEVFAEMIQVNEDELPAMFTKTEWKMV